MRGPLLVVVRPTVPYGLRQLGDGLPGGLVVELVVIVQAERGAEGQRVSGALSEVQAVNSVGDGSFGHVEREGRRILEDRRDFDVVEGIGLGLRVLHRHRDEVLARGKTERLAADSLASIDLDRVELDEFLLGLVELVDRERTRVLRGDLEGSGAFVGHDEASIVVLVIVADEVVEAFNSHLVVVEVDAVGAGLPDLVHHQILIDAGLLVIAPAVAGGLRAVVRAVEEHDNNYLL